MQHNKSIGKLLVILFSAMLLLVSCNNDELISQMTGEKREVINTELEPVTGLEMSVLGMHDSVTMFMLANTFGVEQLNPFENPDGFQDAGRDRVQKFVLSWVEPANVDHYEVRVSRSPIDESNWSSTLAVDYFPIGTVDGKLIVEIPLGTTQIQSGKCTNCGECVLACPFGAISTVNGKSVVDPTQCTSCGECYEACDFDALDGLFAGHSYYFAIRSANESNEISAGITTFDEPYMIRYTTMASIPDSEKEMVIDGKPAWISQKGCYGNCFAIDTTLSTDDNEVCQSTCYIVKPTDNQFDPGSDASVCPVDAIYQAYDDDMVESLNTTRGAIFIDKDKCINCGQCMTQCQNDGYGSVTMEIIQSVQQLFGRN